MKTPISVWISVKEKMPGKGIRVIVLTEKGEITDARRDDSFIGGFKRRFADCDICVEATHWMRVPKVPPPRTSIVGDFS